MKIDFVYDDEGDWVGMYVDGVLKVENHSLSERTVLEAAGIQANYYYVNLEELQRSNCPDTLEELNKDLVLMDVDPIP